MKNKCSCDRFNVLVFVFSTLYYQLRPYLIVAKLQLRPWLVNSRCKLPLFSAHCDEVRNTQRCRRGRHAQIWQLLDFSSLFWNNNSIRIVQNVARCFFTFGPLRKVVPWFLISWLNTRSSLEFSTHYETTN